MRLLSYILLIILGSTNLIAANINSSANKNYHALLIAVDNYASPAWKPLKNPVRDAELLKRTLQERYGFLNIHTLYNRQATRKNVISTLDNLVNDLSENDNLLIFFSGHGLLSGEDGYWVPSEAKTKERYDMIATQEIKQIIGKAQSKHILMLVDACFSSTIFKSGDLLKGDYESHDYYDKVESLISRQAITAGGLRPVLDGEGTHSIFIKYLIQFLSKNNQKALAARELFQMIRFPIKANSPNRPRYGHLQNTGHQGGEFIFRLKPKRACNLQVSIQQGDVVKFNKDGGILKAISNEENLNYRWSLNGKLLTTNQANLKVAKTGTYNIFVTDAEQHCKANAVADVYIVLPEVNLSIQEGDKVAFTYQGELNAMLSGYKGKVQFEWQKDHFIIGRESAIKVKKSGNYTVIAKLPDNRVLATATTKVTIKDRIYTSILGDDVRRIARKFYGDSSYDFLIYKANPDLEKDMVLKIGTPLIIPAKDTPTQLEMPFFTLGANQTFTPFVNSAAPKGGMLTEIVTTVSNDIRQSPTVRFLSDKDITPQTYHGHTTIGFPYTKEQSSAMIFHYSVPLYHVMYVFFEKQNQPIRNVTEWTQQHKTRSDYKKLRVATTRAYKTDELQQYVLNQSISLKTYPTLEACFLALQKGEVNLVATTQMAGFAVLQKNKTLNVEAFAVLKQEIATKSVHAVISKKHPNALVLLQQFNTAFEQLQQAGKINTIIDKHLDLIRKMP